MFNSDWYRFLFNSQFITLVKTVLISFLPVWPNDREIFHELLLLGAMTGISIMLRLWLSGSLSDSSSSSSELVSRSLSGSTILSSPSRLVDLSERENWRDKDDSRDWNNCMMMPHWDSRVEVFDRSPRNCLWANRSCHWCSNEIKIPQYSSSKRCSSRISVIVKLKKFGNEGWAYMFNNNLSKYFALFLNYHYHSYCTIATCLQWHQRRSTFRSKQNIHIVTAIWSR